MKNLLNLIVSKITRTKMLLALIPTALVLYCEIAITPAVLALMTAPICFYIAFEAIVDWQRSRYGDPGPGDDILQRIEDKLHAIMNKGLIFALGAGMIAVMSTPIYAQVTPYTTAEAEIEGNLDPETGPDVNCPAALIECQSEIEDLEAENDALAAENLELEAALEEVQANTMPSVPFFDLFNKMGWFSNMPPWARVTIIGTVNALILGATIWAGSTVEK